MGGTCADEPSPTAPAILGDDQCPECVKAKKISRDCPTCHGWGKADVLIGCPRKAVTPDSYDVPMAADLLAKGTGAQGRGWLNETTSGIAAVRQWWAFETYWRKKLGLNKDG